MKRKLLHTLIIAIALLCFTKTNFAQAPNLGTASGFAIFTATGAFNNVGATTVTGDVGTNVGAFNAFPPGTLTGAIHVADATSLLAATDVQSAYTAMTAISCGSVIGTTLGNGQLLTPGVYCTGAASTMNGNLTLDAQGNPNAVFIIKIGGAFATIVASSITLVNSASFCNVYWQIGGQFTLSDNTIFGGTALVDGAIILLNGASLSGRGLSRAGAINLDNNIIAIATPPLPSPSATGNDTVCQGETGVIYTVPPITNATGYIWTVPVGAVITAGANTNTITVNFSSTSVSGNVTVQGTNSCGIGAISSNYLVTVNPLPASAGTIIGTPTVCQGQTGVIYSVPLIANATSYIWTLPVGAVITAGANTNNITVDFNSTSVSGNVTVQGSNSCGVGAVSSNFVITVNPLPIAAGTITGTPIVCQGQTGVVYSVPLIANATSYIWTLPAGATIIAGANSNSITVDFSATASSGNVTVQGSNSCGTGAVSADFAITANPLPAAAGTITGAATVCQGQTGVVYSVPLIANATSYIWTLPLGATITAGINTNSITVSFSATASSGIIRVQGSNGCGSGTISPNFVVNINSLPGAAGTIY